VKRICDEAPKPIDELNPEIPAWLVETINRLLAKDQAQRFQTAAEVAEILSGQLAHAQQPRPGRVPVLHAVLPLPRAPAATETSIAPGRKSVPTWLLFVSFAFLGALIGRLIPLSDTEWIAALLVGVVVTGVILRERGNQMKLPSSATAALIFGGCLAYWVGLLLGHEMQLHRRTVTLVGDVFFFIFGGLLLGYVFMHRRSRESGSAVGGQAAAMTLGHAAWRDRMHAALTEPWKVAGWMTVMLLGLVLFIPCLIGIGLVVPWLAYRSAEAEMGTMVFDWDADQVVDIKLQGGVWPDVRDFPVISKPFTIRLPAGTYTAKITYRHSDKEYTFEQPLNVAKVRESQLHLLGPMIESDLQERLKNKGLPVRPLGDSMEADKANLPVD
jgi:hypothetical protein